MKTEEVVSEVIRQLIKQGVINPNQQKELTISEEPKSNKDNTPRTISHPYNHYKEVIAKMTAKEMAKYISKAELKAHPFPITYQIGRKIFEVFEIGGRPWISYDTQIKMTATLMDFYKYTKASKIKKYKEMADYLQGRIKAVETDKKLRASHKRNRLLSLNSAVEDIDEQLESI